MDIPTNQTIIREVTADVQILRIVLIGLPYSGCQLVAKVLEQVYGCVILTANIDQKPPQMSIEKYIRQVCFQPYGLTTRATLLISHYHSRALHQLKKRNYVNIILVEAPFKARYAEYLKDKGLEDNHENVSQFMKIDQQFQNEEYEACLEYARVRIWHKGSVQDLKDQIKRKQRDIIRYFRPTWDQYFMKIADVARRRSNCMKTSVGAVIVNSNNRVVSTGYNGTPVGLTGCYKMGCERCNSNQGKQLDQCLCLHAEESALIEVGIGKTQGCRLYTTYFPCFSCAKVIKQAGIKKIYYMDEYEKEDSGKPFINEYFHPEDVVKIPVDNLYY